MKILVYKATITVFLGCVLPLAAWMNGYRGRRRQAVGAGFPADQDLHQDFY